MPNEPITEMQTIVSSMILLVRLPERDHFIINGLTHPKHPGACLDGVLVHSFSWKVFDNFVICKGRIGTRYIGDGWRSPLADLPSNMQMALLDKIDSLPMEDLNPRWAKRFNVSKETSP